MSSEHLVMRWMGRHGSSIESVETFRAPDGKQVEVVCPPRTTMEKAQEMAYKKWKAK